MKSSEDLELDALMELFGDDSENKSVTISSKSNPESPAKNYSKKLKVVPLPFSPEKQELSVLKNSTLEKSLVHTDDIDISSEDENKEVLTEEGKELKKKIGVQSKNFLPKSQHNKITQWKDVSTVAVSSYASPIDKLHTDNFSGIRIINPLIPFDVMQQRMKGRRMIKMSFIKTFIKGGDIEGDWVTIGVLVNKLPPKTSKNGKTFSIWKMTDLHDCEKIISMFLFGAAHAEHWKTSIGTVAGFLNPSIMSDTNKNNGEISLSIDHAGKFMYMGKSKDFSHCVGRKKDGTPCTAVVNKSHCEYCIYHVKREYKKFSAKRSELQASYSGREPSLKDKLLKKQNIFYGGQTFTPTENVKYSSKKTSSKDKLTLLNLGLKRKAEMVETEEKNKSAKKLADLYGPNILKTTENNSEFINSQLTIPNAGSRNLLQHMMKEKTKNEADNLKTITSKDLLIMRDNYRKTVHKESDSAILQNLMPKLGKGLKPGQPVNLDFSISKDQKMCSPQDIAKLKAIQKIKEKGPIAAQNPNIVKKSTDISSKIKAVLDKSIDDNGDYVGSDEEEITIPVSKLGKIDFNSEKIKEIINRKSSHAYEVEMDELEKLETYFNTLEKKERMEEKMISTTEIVCDVVSCKQCKYTAHHATDMCKEERHSLKCHKAIKRFFACKECKSRTCCFTKFPKRSCRNCGGSNYERTGMLRPRSGPKLGSEVLNIRGEEIKYLNSLKS